MGNRTGEPLASAPDLDRFNGKLSAAHQVSLPAWNGPAVSPHRQPALPSACHGGARMAPLPMFNRTFVHITNETQMTVLSAHLTSSSANLYIGCSHPIEMASAQAKKSLHFHHCIKLRLFKEASPSKDPRNQCRSFALPLPSSATKPSTSICHASGNSVHGLHSWKNSVASWARAFAILKFLLV